MKLNKTSIVSSIIAVIILSVAGWYFLRPLGSVEFALAPQQVILSLDGHTRLVTNKQIVKLSPGTYESTFSSEGFKTEKKKIIIEKNKKNRVVIALTPITEAAKKLLAGSTESQKVIKEYKEVKYKELIDSLPLSGVDYSITGCQSVKHPKSDVSALCITASTPEGEVAAKKTLTQLGYATDELELLIGNENIKSIIKRDSYQIDYYTNVQTENSNKPALFITPLNVPFEASTTTFNPQLENIKTAALNDLKVNGYVVDDYAIYYSNAYLSKYNPGANTREEHAMPPIF